MSTNSAPASDPASRPAPTLWQTIRDRVTDAEGDVSSLLADIVVFVGYFGLCLYAGGVAYVQAFNGALSLDILSTDNIVATAQTFVVAALGPWGSALFLPLAAAILCFVYVIARFALRLWFGLVTIVTLFFGLMVVCVSLGAGAGTSMATDVFLSKNNPLPTFKTSSINGVNYELGAFRLLHDSGTHLYVLQPTDSAESAREVTALNKSELKTFQVIPK